MRLVRTICPKCEAGIAFESDSTQLICPACNSIYDVREQNESISLRLIEPCDASDAPATAQIFTEEEVKLAEIDEMIEQVESEIDSTRSREQSGPLQKGCAFFGLFGLVLFVIAAFMLLGRDLVGGPIFYLVLVVVVALGFLRIRRRLTGQVPVAQLREDRRELERVLAELEAERSRIARN